MKNRLTNYDFIRVIACIFVIMIHIEDKPFSFNIRMIYTTVLFTSNGLFYMLSGKFNLERTYNSIEDYIITTEKNLFLSYFLIYWLVYFSAHSIFIMNPAH